MSHFQCQQSGNCCRADGTVYVTATDAKFMARKLNMTEFDFFNRYVKRKNGQLVIADHAFRPRCFLNECNECQVYNHRPKQCRTYPDWPEIWASDETVIAESHHCPALRTAIANIV